jgi:hypothetical protein
MVAAVTIALDRRLHAAMQERSALHYNVFGAADICCQESPAKIKPNVTGTPVFQLDTSLQAAFSALIRAKQLSLHQTICLWRGQTLKDPRPNKALLPDHLDWLFAAYPHRERLLAAATRGIDHQFLPQKTVQDGPRSNHKSAEVMHNALIRSIREGQDNGTYLVVDLDVALNWPEVTFSPFGCVEKADANPATEARVIHDLSYPVGASTNSCSSQSDLPPLIYEHVGALARRIEALRANHPSSVIMIMKGDVKGAFRHLHVRPSVSARFAGHILSHNAAVIDLALPFGWTGSPAHYGVFGSGISHLVRRESPHSILPESPDREPFFCYEWVDDHILIEIDRGARLSTCATALRLAMLATLGPRSVNEKKYTSWSTRLIALGLEWDTDASTVSMPLSKIAKASARVRDMLAQDRTSRSSLDQLLGSLRHVCSCIRSARPFYQRLVSLWRSSPRIGKVRIDDESRLDLMWFTHILNQGHLRSIPLSMFMALPAPSVELFMDASDTGLCVLDPARRCYLRVRFDDEEIRMIQAQQPACAVFSINVRELLSAVFAMLIWGPAWTPSAPAQCIHVHFWIDNTTAVSWCNRLYSTNTFGQELTRVLGAVEACWSLRVSSSHLSGAVNRLADLGSRAWEEPQLSRWLSLTDAWSQVTVPVELRKIYKPDCSPYKNAPWPSHPDASTITRGHNGARSDVQLANPHGSPATTLSTNRYSWLRSPFPAGHTPRAEFKCRLTPYGLNSAISDDIIASTVVSHLNSTQVTPSPSQACDVSAPPRNREHPSPSTCSSGSAISSISPSPTTASFMGLRCWASSLC